MNIDQMKSNLRMHNLYFSNCQIRRDVVVSNGEYNIDIERHIEKLGEHEYRVVLDTSIRKKDVALDITTKAEFIYESEDYSNEELVINANTVAIMFPFVRSQVTLMTSQPGMAPIVLPPINTQNFS